MKRFFSIIFSAYLCILISCVDEVQPYTIPFAPVYFNIDINGLDSDLTHFAHKTFTRGRTVGEQVGYAGLLIFRDAQGEIFAYDLCCPHEDDKNIRVEPTDNGKAVCPKCGTVFVTMYGLGSVESGVANQSLQRYNVSKSSRGEGAFVVTNK